MAKPYAFFICKTKANNFKNNIDMKFYLFLFLGVITLLSCSDRKSSLPSGTPNEVLPNDLYAKLSKQYDSIGNFEFGYAIVKKQKYGLIDYKGQETLECVFDTMLTISPEAKVIKQNNKYGFIEYNGNKITEIAYKDVKFEPNFKKAKLVALKEDKLWGILDLNGKMLVPYEYDNIASIDTNCVVVGKNGKYGIIDSVGNYTVEMKYDTIYYHYFNESNISLVEQNRCIGLVNSKNKVVTACEYNCEYYTSRSYKTRDPYIDAPKNGYIKFEKFQSDSKKTKLFGMVECETGKVVIPFDYDDMGDYSEGLVWAKKDNKFGYLDIQGRVVIQFKYDKAYNFSGGFAAVGEKNGYYHAVMGTLPNIMIGFINKNGSLVIPYKFQPQLDTTPEFKEGLSPMGVAHNNYWGINIGYINDKGDFVIKPIYNKAEPFRNGLGIVERKNNVGCINCFGKEVIPLKYQYVCFENDTLIYCAIWDNGTTDYYINKHGKVRKK